MVWDSQGDLQSTVWQHIYRQCREISLEISHLFLKHHEALFVFTIQITSLLCHGTSEPFPSVSGVSTSFTVVMTAFLPSLRPQSVSLWSLKSNVIGLNCLSTPPLLLLASPFNSLSDSIPPHFYYSLTEVNVLPLIYLGTLNNTP